MSRHGNRFAATAAVLAIGLGVAVASPGADAQSYNHGQTAPASCAPQEALTEKLGERFGEAVAGQGVDAAGNLVQVFTSENGTWTIAVTIPGGPSCIVSVGEGWEDTRFAQRPEPAPDPGHAS